jgi:small-conductance mechanosensitive channel
MCLGFMTKIQIIEVIVAVLIYAGNYFLINHSVKNIIAQNTAAKTRAKIVKKAMHLLSFIIFLIVILSFFGVDQGELMVFIGSALTVMGIAMFAQWSILSNITAGVIIFFNHSVSLDDHISILDKDYEVEGRISDIGLFFILIKTEETQITIPNNVFLQKMVKGKIK